MKTNHLCPLSLMLGCKEVCLTFCFLNRQILLNTNICFCFQRCFIPLQEILVALIFLRKQKRWFCTGDHTWLGNRSCSCPVCLMLKQLKCFYSPLKTRVKDLLLIRKYQFVEMVLSGIDIQTHNRNSCDGDFRQMDG